MTKIIFWKVKNFAFDFSFFASKVSTRSIIQSQTKYQKCPRKTSTQKLKFEFSLFGSQDMASGSFEMIYEALKIPEFKLNYSTLVWNSFLDNQVFEMFPMTPIDRRSLDSSWNSWIYELTNKIRYTFAGFQKQQTVLEFLILIYSIFGLACFSIKDE